MVFTNELSDPLFEFHTYTIENLNWYTHFHESFEICFVIEGSIDIKIGTKLYTLKKNDGLIIFPKQLHSYETKEYSNLQIVTFLPKFISEFSEKYKNMVPEINKLNGLEKYIHILYENNKFIRKGILYYILGKFSMNTEFVLESNNEESQILFEILKYIEKNYMYKCSLKSISVELSYSYTYLSKIFNEQMHVNFSQYLNKYRINRAVYILSSKNKIQIQEVASLCGYESLCSFNRNFKYFTGCTPREMINGNKI